MTIFMIFLITFIDFLIIGLLHSVGIDLTFLLLLVSILINILIIFITCDKYKIQISLGFILRFFVMILDYYFSNIIKLPHSGIDTENFYNAGLLYSKVDNVFDYDYFGGIYTKLIGITLKLTGDNRLFIQYVNIVLSIFTILTLIDILIRLGIKDKISNEVILLLCFFPTNVLISSLVLRESWIIFLLIIGLKEYLIYINSNKYYDLIKSSIFISLASLFHSGAIIVLFGIIISELTTRNKYSILVKITIIMITIISFYFLKDLLFTKFITQKDIVTSRSDYVSDAGSRYLGSIYINNISGVIKYGGLKMFYFLFSPTVLYWRGFSDIISFALDSLIYIYITFKIIFQKKTLDYKTSNYYKSLFISLAISVFVFGLGTSTAGTAIRHRNKLLVIFLIMYAIIENNKVTQTEIVEQVSNCN